MSEFDKLIESIKTLYPVGESIKPKTIIIGKLINGKIVEYEVNKDGIKTNEPN